jgi:hypothetical protein
VDIGVQFSCIHRDVMQTLAELGMKAKKNSCWLSCHLANGLHCNETEMVQLHFLLGTFSWNFQFKILEGDPFPIILGLDFFPPHSKSDGSRRQRILLPFCSTLANEI